MRILVTGARGFVGRNLCAELGNIRDGKSRAGGLVSAAEAERLGLGREACVEEVREYDRENTPEELDAWCADCDFVFHLAGVNRPKDPAEFMAGNFGFTSELLGALKRHGNRCPVMVSSSVQATLAGRYAGSEYGKSKLAGEELVFRYGEETGARVLVYRFPNLYGKWCRPNYNSAVATFCHHIARGLPVEVSDPAVELELLHIDDLVGEMLRAARGGESRCEFEGARAVPSPGGRYCHCPLTHRATLGRIVETLREFAAMPATLRVPDMPAGGFRKRLMSTFLSYLPPERVSFPLRMNTDARGSFTELVRTASCGQVSVNVSRPGVTKGEHWHHSKWEQFVVVSGRALIRMRREGAPEEETISLEVSGREMRSVVMLPGYTHSITNLSDTDDLVTVMYCNEPFDPGRPDTYRDPV